LLLVKKSMRLRASSWRGAKTATGDAPNARDRVAALWVGLEIRATYEGTPANLPHYPTVAYSGAGWLLGDFFPRLRNFSRYT
jgi:hypothetical protein